MTDWLRAALLGVVQGLTEFLPISSTAHLRVVPALFGWSDPGAAFSAVTQVGTTAAVLLYFRDDLWRIGRAWLVSLRTRRVDSDARLGWYILLATIPIGLLGLAFEEQIETSARSLPLIGAALIVLGLALLGAERVASLQRPMEKVRGRDAVALGLAQAAALVPGVSRSGATLTAGLLLGLTRPAAARFSFLLSVPAVVASALFQLPDIVGGPVDPAATAVAVLTAFGSGYASIAWLLRFLTSHTTVVFVVYRVLLGVLVLGLAATGVIV